MSRYPEGQSLISHIKRRHLTARFWQYLFLSALLVGIITLVALLLNIINDAFGLVAVQNVVAPQSLALDYQKNLILNAPDTIVNEDDDVLAAAIQDNPYAIGFFSGGYYQQHRDSLRTLSIDGALPNVAVSADNDYPLIRPLYLYTTQAAMQEKPQVAAFLRYYLTYVNQEIEELGYSPADAAAQETGQQIVTANAPPPTALSELGGDIVIAGSSTLIPLSERLLQRFAADGYPGQAILETSSSSGALRQLCADGSIDIAAASRPINQAEFEACRIQNRPPLEIRVGTDALVIVVSQQNNFLTDVSAEQLRLIFSEGVAWADLSPEWPNEPISRAVPAQNSGALDFFAESVFSETLADLPKEELTNILAANISTGLGRRLERDQRFFDDRLVFEDAAVFAEVCARAAAAPACDLPERSQANVYNLVLERVVQSQVQHTWALTDSLFRRGEVLVAAQLNYPNATIEFRSWLTPQFLTNPQSSEAEFAGVRTAILGSLWTIAITILFSFPVGVGAAIYLEEYARDNWLNRTLQTNINNLAGVPSIIYGMLGLAIFVRVLETISSGAAFGAVESGATANGRTIFSAGLTLGLLILPIIIISAQEAIRAVPASLRQASLALGATRWQTIQYHVLPNAFSGILTGTILAMSRAIGETAPLVVVGASTFITVDPSGPFSKFTTLPIQIYQWTSRPQDEFRSIAAAAILVLLIMLITLNATAIILRNRYARRTA